MCNVQQPSFDKQCLLGSLETNTMFRNTQRFSVALWSAMDHPYSNLCINIGRQCTSAFAEVYCLASFNVSAVALSALNTFQKNAI